MDDPVWLADAVGHLDARPHQLVGMVDIFDADELAEAVAAGFDRCRFVPHQSLTLLDAGSIRRSGGGDYLAFVL